MWTECGHGYPVFADAVGLVSLESDQFDGVDGGGGLDVVGLSE